MGTVYAVTKGCTKCGWCVGECPVKAISFDRNGAHIDETKCTGCGKCYRDCASEAIEAVERAAPAGGAGGER